jgi:hypothetical protein
MERTLLPHMTHLPLSPQVQQLFCSFFIKIQEYMKKPMCPWLPYSPLFTETTGKEAHLFLPHMIEGEPDKCVLQIWKIEP